MKRLTTDKPSNNTEAMLNYAYAKDGYVHLSYADGEEDVRLTEYLCRAAQEIGCEFATEENILNGDTCLECDCKVSILNVLAIQAAELRERLKKYEDAEEQGLLVRLPCKVGDSFFAVRKFCDEYGELEEPVEHWDSDCYGCNLPCNGKLKVVERKFNSIHHIIAEMESIGDSIFLTREEAEKALEDANGL